MIGTIVDQAQVRPPVVGSGPVGNPQNESPNPKKVISCFQDKVTMIWVFSKKNAVS